MLDQGAEVVFETARLWMELGFFADGQFRINAVTGPDEYTTVVDNNAYTNLMAKQNLEIAIRITEWLAAVAPEKHAALVAGGEVDGWRRAAESMYVPRHERLGIVLQDEHLLGRKRWDFENTPPENYPLLLYYHPLELYRHQVIKQTDVVLATYLASASRRGCPSSGSACASASRSGPADRGRHDARRDRLHAARRSRAADPARRRGAAARARRPSARCVSSLFGPRPTADPRGRESPDPRAQVSR
jgi:Glycosyl hydrolase family 65 central catalytic domain